MNSADTNPALLWREYRRLCDSGRQIRQIVGVFPPSGPDGARFEFADGTSVSFLFPEGCDSSALWEVFGERAGQAFSNGSLG